MNISNGKLSIRNATVEDAPLLSKWWNDGRVMAHAGFPNGLGISENQVAVSLEKDNDLQRRLIIELENEPIGEMSYRTPEEKIAEIGIKICAPEQQNKGYGTECLKMLIEQLFVNMGYNKIILDTNLNNKRAQQVYERLGFRKVRTNMDAWKDQIGERQSSVDYEMSKEDYAELYNQ